MTKSVLVARVAAKTEFSNASVAGVLDAVISTISEALARGESVSIAGFGTFSVKDRASREGRNPLYGRADHHCRLEGGVVLGREGASRRLALPNTSRVGKLHGGGCYCDEQAHRIGSGLVPAAMRWRDRIRRSASESRSTPQFRADLSRPC